MTFLESKFKKLLKTFLFLFIKICLNVEFIFNFKYILINY